MDILPVIDVKHGVVVHARGGRRDRYHPVQSPLAPSPDPLQVVEGLLRLHPFQRVYVADLDAIETGQPAYAVLQALRGRFPETEFWIDAGLSDERRLFSFLDRDLGVPVLGTESLNDASLLAAVEPDAAVLSLDYRGNRFLGPSSVHQAPERWPTRVLFMDLARVGAGRGPDFRRLAALCRRCPGRRVYAAGGVRDRSDLERLEQLGVAGALLASALHDGRVGAQTLRRLAR